MGIITFIVIMWCICCFSVFVATYFSMDRKINKDVCGVTVIFGTVISLLVYVMLSAATYEDVSARLISKNKVSSVFEVEYKKIFGLIHSNKIENIEKFTIKEYSSKLEYKDRFFIIMKLAGQDVSKYADINGNEVIYRMTPLQEMEEKIICQ